MNIVMEVIDHEDPQDPASVWASERLGGRMALLKRAFKLGLEDGERA